MPFTFSYDVPGNPHMYDAVKAEVGTEAPAGLIVQMVVQVDSGLRHLMVWSTPEDWETFRSERVEPAVRKVLASAGIPEPAAPPEISPLHLIDLWIPSSVPN